MSPRATRARDPYDDYIDVGGVGHVGRMYPFEGITDEQAEELEQELADKDARRVPLGFRAECSQSDPKAGSFPSVPRFDLPPPRSPNGKAQRRRS